ncbi:LURP-one-related family protein, partial [Actinoplanes sp. NPDC051633]|uniref:LURP-one-related family protein n=1 Tax=Actinoplanes sp. NPDC051633 TaxID=3155670 RepID=UPI00341EA392
GRTVATVKKAHLTPLRDRWVVHMEHDPEMDVTGNITDHEYTIARGGREVAVVTKRWLRMRDTYTVDVAGGEDPALVLAVVAVVDHMAHDK